MKIMIVKIEKIPYTRFAPAKSGRIRESILCRYFCRNKHGQLELYFDIYFYRQLLHYLFFWLNMVKKDQSAIMPNL